MQPQMISNLKNIVLFPSKLIFIDFLIFRDKNNSYCRKYYVVHLLSQFLHRNRNDLMLENVYLRFMAC